jgi:hypothetical protein
MTPLNLGFLIESTGLSALASRSSDNDYLPMTLFLTSSSATGQPEIWKQVIHSRNAVNQYIFEARPPAMRLPISGDISRLVPSRFFKILLIISNPDCQFHSAGRKTDLQTSQRNNSDR